jgi:hypothetical protein
VLDVTVYYCSECVLPVHLVDKPSRQSRGGSCAAGMGGDGDLRNLACHKFAASVRRDSRAPR